jgi:UDP-N-acetyl-D-glucosamine dehydrogenase
LLNNSKNLKVSVVGLGFVGRPIVEACLSCEFEVIGIDTNPEKLEVSVRDFQNLKFKATSNIEEVSNSQIIILALPTPLNPDGSSDLSALEQVSSNIASFVDENTLVIIESTYAPHTTRNVIAPLLCAKSGLNYENLLLAYSPERINPGDKKWNLRNTPKLLAGLNEKSVDTAKNFYSNFIDNLVMVDNLEIAETAKLLENIFRFVNISFINEFQDNCNSMGIDALKVIAAAETKPFGFIGFKPSLGIGGHCIPIAPFHFISALNQSKKNRNEFISLAKIKNDQQIDKVVESLINFTNGDIKHKKVLLVGITYKSDVADIRESPRVRLLERLKELGVNISWYDPLIMEFESEKASPLDTTYEIILLCTENESCFNLVREKTVGQIIDLNHGLQLQEKSRM